MRQWKTKSSNEYVIDERNREDILQEISTLAESYTPEWKFDIQNPDIGSVIALLFADQMEENIKRLNIILERDYIELMNMLGLSLKPAYPAHSIVLMNMVADTIPGLKIPKGTKLLGSGGDEPYIFETSHSIYVTEARLVSAFMTSAQTGAVIPLLGQYPDIVFLEGTPIPVIEPITDEMESEETTESEKNTEELSVEVKESKVQKTQPDTVKEDDYSKVLTQDIYRDVNASDDEEEEMRLEPFTLFDFQKESYGKTGLVMYHPYLFDEIDNDIRMDIKGNQELAEDICNRKYILSYFNGTDFEPITNMHVENGRYLVFQKSGISGRVREQGRTYAALLLEPAALIEKNVTVADIRFSSTGSLRKPEFVVNGNGEQEVEEFLPFGNTISLFMELFIGHRYFGKPGSQITMNFDLSFGEHLITPPRAKEDETLKIIKRRQDREADGAVAEIYVDEISFEYYNGTGWRKLQTRIPVKQIFHESKPGACEITFACPKDWMETEAGGCRGYCIRMQVLASENCYFQPAIHHYPIMTNLSVSYSYEKHYERPTKLVSFYGSHRRDITAFMAENPMTPVLFRSEYNDTSLYLGFDSKMEDGPISILFRMGETEGYTGEKLVFYYSTRDGFARLKLTDWTDGLSHTGTIRFMPPTDMAKRTLEGQEAYWIKVTDDRRYLEENPGKRPMVYTIAANAVEVDNIDTMEEDDYYMDTFGPDMKFPLNASSNILHVDVWVNETEYYSMSEMKRLLLQEPDRTKATYNFQGEVQQFFVKWKEVDNFDSSTSKDRHFVVDRLNNMLYFGDGVNVMIPKNTSGIAFQTVISCCNGKSANVAPGAVGGALGNMMFVDQIYNPIQAFGGMDMETIEEALRRGTAVLNSRNRLVSAIDYEREALDFSHRISQVRVVTGMKKDSSYDQGAISLVVLMEDYKDGSYSFINLRRRLKEHILSKCELTVDPSKLEIVEPLFVRVSVEAWIQVVDADDSFEVQQSLIEVLDRYLDPVLTNNWEIGRDAAENQIQLRLNMEKGSTLIRRMMITAGYQTAAGWHETDLKNIKDNPFAIVVSGNHKIHFL